MKMYFCTSLDVRRRGGHCADWFTIADDARTDLMVEYRHLRQVFRLPRDEARAAVIGRAVKRGAIKIDFNRGDGQ